MKKHSVFLSAAMALSMIFSTVPVSAQEAEIQASDEETALDYLYFQQTNYTTVAGKTSNTYLYPMSFPMITDSQLTVQVEDTSIAELERGSLLVGKKAGTTKAYCEYGGKRAEATITVLDGDYADWIMINEVESNYLLPGEKLQLSYTLSSESDSSKTEFKDEKVTWDVVDYSGSGAVTVDANGLVTAVRTGYATVRAHIASGIYSNQEIVVAPVIQSMKFSSDISVPYREWGYLDMDQYLTCSPEGSEQREIVWTSSNEDVLTANNGGGYLSMKGPGVTTVTAASADDSSVRAQMTVELYEPVTPTAIRRTSPENVTIYKNAYYGAVNFNVGYSPEKASTATAWTSSDPELLDVWGDGPSASYRYFGTGTVQLTAASEEIPSLTTTFNATIVDEPLPADLYTTDVYAAWYSEETGTLGTKESVSSVLAMDVGDIVWLTIADDSDTAIPSPGSRIKLFDDSAIVTPGAPSGLVENVSGNHISSNPAVELYAKAAGEETFNLGNRTLTIRVNDSAEEDNLIHEARILSDQFIEPAGAGSGFIWPEDMRTPEGTHYMTPAEFNETQHGQGVGDTIGALYEGTPGHRGMRITWDNFTFEANKSYVYICSLYAEEGYTFADDIEVWLGSRKADLVTNNGSSVRVWFQFGPYEEQTGKEVKRIYFFDSSYTITVGQNFVLIPHAEPEDATSKITITSSNDKIVSNEDNLLLGRKTGTVTVTAQADNGVKASVTIRVIFTDVPAEGKYYSDPVYWAVDKGITNGYTDDDGFARTFKPENFCTREAVVTFLWRLAGKPNPKSMKSPFKDVQDSSKYYYKAVLWAAEKGITGGYSDGTFRPSATCLREHVVTFLYRYAGKPDPGVTKNPFNDVKPSDYYYKAALWANAKGIAKGYSTGEHAGGFGPKLDCLREHVVTFLYRYAK